MKGGRRRSRKRSPDTREEATREAAKESPYFKRCGRTVTLGAGEEELMELACDFEPDRIVMDPEARVLMLLRKSALHTF